MTVRRCLLTLFAPLAPLVALAAGCSRTPPEPSPPAAAPGAATTDHATVAPRAAESAKVPSAAGRCVTPMASAAPAVPPPASAVACPPDPEGQGNLPTAEVAFPDAPGHPHVAVELAKTPHDIERGLMYRRSMDSDHGMLFRLGDRREHTFWMHNTCIPLDMLFVDDDGLVVGIVEAAEPLTDTTRSVGCPSTYVLEVNAGWARRHGVAPGQRMGIPAAAR